MRVPLGEVLRLPTFAMGFDYPRTLMSDENDDAYTAGITMVLKVNDAIWLKQLMESLSRDKFARASTKKKAKKLLNKLNLHF